MEIHIREFPSNILYTTISMSSTAGLAQRERMAGAVDNLFPSLPPTKRMKLSSGGSDPETVEELISTGTQKFFY